MGYSSVLLSVVANSRFLHPKTPPFMNNSSCEKSLEPLKALYSDGSKVRKNSISGIIITGPAGMGAVRIMINGISVPKTFESDTQSIVNPEERFTVGLTRQCRSFRLHP